MAKRKAKKAKTEITVGKQPADDKPWQFKPGQSGNPAGRPKGVRNKILSDALLDLQRDWLENGAAAIVAMREKNPGRYVETVFNMMPREMTFDDDQAEGFMAVWAALAKASASKDE